MEDNVFIEFNSQQEINEINNLTKKILLEKKNIGDTQAKLRELDGFKNAAMCQDENGKRLLNTNQYSSALFLRMYTHENFSKFKEALQTNFNEPKFKNWNIRNDFQKNAVKIW